MYRYATSEVFNAVLTVKTPVFVGSGAFINKKGFITERDRIGVLDMNALMREVYERGLLSDFQKLMMTEVYGSAGDFMKTFFTPDEIKKMTLYTCRSTDVFSGGKPPAEIKQFWHTPDNRPYIPGSSLKGALRTCLIGARLLDDDAVRTNEIRGKVSALENEYKEIMSRLSVSDSEPVTPSSLTLCKKYDVKTSGQTKPLNLIRECLAPGTKLKFRITIDSGDGVMTLDKIKSSIKLFSKFYSDQVKKYYKAPDRSGRFSYDGNLILGGGSGYLSKTVVYEAAEYEDALDLVVEIMTRSFRQHHMNDRANNVSPHMLKYTQYNGLFYPFGICSLEFA